MSGETPKPVRYIEGIAVVGLTAVAAALRTVDMNRGLWEDEAFEYMHGAAVPLWDSLTYQSFPLLHVLAHFALYLSDAEWALRLPSVVAGTLCVGAIYALARRALSGPAALLAGALVVFNAFHIVSSMEARFYGLGALFAVVTAWALHRALTTNTVRAWVAFAAGAAACVATQLLLAPYVAALCAGGTLWLVGRHAAGHREKTIQRFLRMCAGAAIAVATLATFMLVQNMALGSFGTWDSRVTYKASKEALEEELAGDEKPRYQLTPPDYFEYFTEYFPHLKGDGTFLLGGAALCGFAFLVVRDRLLACLLTAALILTPAPFYIVSVHHWFHPRYFSEVIPIAIVLVAAGADGVAELARTFAGSVSRGLRDSRVGASAIRLATATMLTLLLAPETYESVRALYESDMSGGQHPDQDNKAATLAIREVASSRDIATQAFARPDWRFYYRRNLGDLLTEPAVRGAPFTLWYVNAYQDATDWNEIPTGATLDGSIRLTRPQSRVIRKYVLDVPRLTDWTESLRFRSEQEPSVEQTSPITIEVRNHGEKRELVSERIPAMPHRYAELIVDASGSAQFYVAMDFYSADGRKLWSESKSARDLDSPRGAHPTGARSPEVDAANGTRRLKLAIATPPLTAALRVRIGMAGETRVGEALAVDSVSLQSDWTAASNYLDVPLDRDSVHPWRRLSGKSTGCAITASHETCKMDTVGSTDEITVYSQDLRLSPTDTLSIRLSYRGAAAPSFLRVNLLDEQGARIDYHHLAQHDPSLGRRYTTIATTDGDTTVLEATVKVPMLATFAQIAFGLPENRSSGDTFELDAPEFQIATDGAASP